MTSGLKAPSSPGCSRLLPDRGMDGPNHDRPRSLQRNPRLSLRIGMGSWGLRRPTKRAPQYTWRTVRFTVASEETAASWPADLQYHIAFGGCSPPPGADECWLTHQPG